MTRLGRKCPLPHRTLLFLRIPYRHPRNRDCSDIRSLRCLSRRYIGHRDDTCSPRCTTSPDRIWSSSLPAAYIRYSDTPSLLDTSTSPPRIAVSAVRLQWLHPRPNSTCSHHQRNLVNKCTRVSASWCRNCRYHWVNSYPRRRRFLVVTRDNNLVRYPRNQASRCN